MIFCTGGVVRAGLVLGTQMSYLGEDGAGD
jgi:hypothetical protein